MRLKNKEKEKRYSPQRERQREVETEREYHNTIMVWVSTVTKKSSIQPTRDAFGRDAHTKPSALLRFVPDPKHDTTEKQDSHPEREREREVEVARERGREADK